MSLPTLSLESLTRAESARLIGRDASMRVNLSSSSVRVPVKILDARRTYGRWRFFVSPIDGEGSAWVGSDRLRVEGGAR